MKARVPVLPTAVVAIAVAAMIALGMWQLQRRDWKEALIARYLTASAEGGEAPFPRDAAAVEGALFHHANVTCVAVTGQGATSGRNAAGDSGWAQTATCRLADGGSADIVLGWSNAPAATPWAGGLVSGLIVPSGKDKARLLADPPQAGLAASAKPDPRDLPNNHFGYAIQWFLFAAVAVVIYVLALRKRQK